MHKRILCFFLFVCSIGLLYAGEQVKVGASKCDPSVESLDSCGDAAIHVEARAPDPQFASSTCQKCRDDCTTKRESCKTRACQSNGGQDSGQQCKEPKNYQGFIDALKACEAQEQQCLDLCNKGACKQ